MPERDILDRLARGETLLMDGATGSMIQRRGVDLSRGSTDNRLGVWSATANLDAPDVVRSVHEDYLKVGADIVTSNSFWTSRPKLAKIGEDSRWEEYTRTAGNLAAAARDAINPTAYVADGIAPPVSSLDNTNEPEVLVREFTDQTRVLAAAGVDVMLPEYVGPIADCIVSVDACAGVGLPVMLGLKHVTTDGAIGSGESFSSLATALRGHRVDAVLLMCSSPEAISACLPRLRDAFEGAIGCYANIGYNKNPRYGAVPGEQWHVIDRDTYPPSRYAEFAAEWKSMGAQIIGGCCASGPEHIEAIWRVVNER